MKIQKILNSIAFSAIIAGTALAQTGAPATVTENIVVKYTVPNKGTFTFGKADLEIDATTNSVLAQFGFIASKEGTISIYSTNGHLKDNNTSNTTTIGYTLNIPGVATHKSSDITDVTTTPAKIDYKTANTNISQSLIFSAAPAGNEPAGTYEDTVNFVYQAKS